MTSKEHSNLKTYISSSHTDKAWANRKLRFAIATLQGKYECITVWKRPLQTVLIVKEELLAAGYVWQAERIDNWIHRLQPRKADSVRAVEVAH